MVCDQAKEVGPAIMSQNGGSGDQKFSFKRSAQVITKDKVKRQDEKLQVVDPQDLFNRLISLALVLTSGGGDGLPISLTKIMGYELSQFPASLIETDLPHASMR